MQLCYRLWIYALLILPSSLRKCCAKSIFHIHNSSHHNSIHALKDPPTPTTTTTEKPETVRDIVIGPCVWAIGRKCPDSDIKFYLYTRKNPMDRQNVYIGETLEKSNLTASYFNPRHPTKIIIHGYNSDMFLHPLQMMREEYFANSDYNLFYVDWSILSPGPCYVSAVHNTKHTGACVAQLVTRILESGSADMHVIGFSLGAQLANYIARNLGSFLLPRITGLDPAMPLFATASNDDKLDPSDAAFVDVLHTNALVQGKLERCGHADFYMNGGIMQPGCYAPGTNSFACSHQRAPAYYLESIRSPKGFWGWSCSSYLFYLLGMCPPTNYLLEAGEHIRYSTRGMFFVETNDTAPYALGKWTDLPTLGVKKPTSLTIAKPTQVADPLLQHIDEWGKLDTKFNNQANSLTADSWIHYAHATVAPDTHGISTESKDSGSTSVEELEFEDINHHKNNMADDHNLFVRPIINWNQYKQNLTQGHIENSIFQVPQIQRT